jgi:hypothetical protein
MRSLCFPESETGCGGECSVRSWPRLRPYTPPAELARRIDPGVYRARRDASRPGLAINPCRPFGLKRRSGTRYKPYPGHQSNAQESRCLRTAAVNVVTARVSSSVNCFGSSRTRAICTGPFRPHGQLPYLSGRATQSARFLQHHSPQRRPALRGRRSHPPF